MLRDQALVTYCRQWQEGRREVSPFGSNKLLDQLSQLRQISPGDRTEATTDLFYLILFQSKTRYISGSVLLQELVALMIPAQSLYIT